MLLLVQVPTNLFISLATVLVLRVSFGVTHFLTWTAVNTVVNADRTSSEWAAPGVNKHPLEP